MNKGRAQNKIGGVLMTKTTKTFEIEEKESMELFLVEMAAEGFFVKDMKQRTFPLKKGYIFEFQEKQPKSVRYNVVVANTTSEVEENEFIDFCESAGWIYICKYKKIFIFMTEERELVSIETDMKTTFRLVCDARGKEVVVDLLLPVLFGIPAILLIPECKTALSSLGLFFELLFIVYMVYKTSRAFLFLSWKSKGEKALQNGEAVKFKKTKQKEKKDKVFTVIEYVLWGVAILYILSLLVLGVMQAGLNATIKTFYSDYSYFLWAVLIVLGFNAFLKIKNKKLGAKSLKRFKSSSINFLFLFILNLSASLSLLNAKKVLNVYVPEDFSIESEEDEYWSQESKSVLGETISFEYSSCNLDESSFDGAIYKSKYSFLLKGIEMEVFKENDDINQYLDLYKTIDGTQIYTAEGKHGDVEDEEAITELDNSDQFIYIRKKDALLEFYYTNFNDLTKDEVIEILLQRL